MDLEAAFDIVTAPEGQHGPPLYAVTPISGFQSYLVGKDQESFACLLVATADDTTTVQAPIRLEAIDVQFDLRCHLRTVGHPPREGVFTVIRCRSSDRETVRYFLSVCQTVVKMLGDRPQRRAVASAVNRLVAIFRPAQSLPARAVNGLFGELYVISRSCNPAKAVAAWRIGETARFDFTSGDARLDVKVSGGRLRTHVFSYEQCNPPPGTFGVVASLLAERIAAGVSIKSLIERIERQLGGDANLILKVHEVVVATLGSSLIDALSATFDVRLAESSLRFFRVSDVPAVRGTLAPGVSDVHFSSDLSALAAASLVSLIGQCPTLEDLLPEVI
jgi:hypothetical protein